MVTTQVRFQFICDVGAMCFDRFYNIPTSSIPGVVRALIQLSSTASNSRNQEPAEIPSRRSFAHNIQQDISRHIIV